MALSGNPALVTQAITTSGTSTVTASITPQGFVVLCCWAKHGTVDFTNTSTVSGCGLTWAKLGAVLVSGNHSIGQMWVGYGTPTAGAVTLTHNQTPSAGRLYIVDAHDLAASNPGSGGATNSGTGTSGSLTATATTGKWQVVMFFHDAAEVTTPQASPGPWRELYDDGNGLEIQVGGGNPSAVASWTSNVRWVAVGAEFVSAYADSGLPEEVVAIVHRELGTLVGASSSSDDDFGDGPKGIWGVFDGGL